jgi:hypothetical protein
MISYTELDGIWGQVTPTANGSNRVTSGEFQTHPDSREGIWNLLTDN